jgi:hypothetical protein
MRAYIIIILLITGLSVAAQAQSPDTLTRDHKTENKYRKIDSVNSRPFVPKVTKEKIYHPDSTHNPHTAVIRSLILPGLGQAYNKSWWKIPLIYGGLASFSYYFVINNRDYHDYLAIAKYQEAGISYDDPIYAHDPRRNLYITYGNFPQDAVINVKDGARRNRDLCVLGFLATWGVNAIDAYIVAKFKHSYSMDNNFGDIKVSGGLINQPAYAANFNNFTPALTLTLTLK